jgi:BRCA1-associated protein
MTGASDTMINSEGGPNRAASLAQEKIEAIGTEYSHLLVSQLDSQRAFYTDKLSELKIELATMTESAESAEREYSRLLKKAEKATELARSLKAELNTEREVSKGLMANIKKLTYQQDSKVGEIAKMEAQVCMLCLRYINF